MMTDGPTRLLVSVRSADEALAALDGGADVIDVKEPLRGSLGAASPQVIREVIEAVAGRLPVSAALGELTDSPAPLDASLRLDYAKVGLRGAASSDWQHRLRELHARMPQAMPVAVAYVDRAALPVAAAPTVDDVLDWAIESNAAGILLDTCDKTTGDLLRWCEITTLDTTITRARAAGLFVAFAGSLRDAAIREILAAGLRPDLIAVRGAVCRGHDRAAAIDSKRVAALKAIIAAHAAPPAKSPLVPVSGRAG